ncbi:GGDEF domain-containing phosphodiesterase [Salirhabdus sp. Marseille-P4669]|uniref:GGDEF domain-containing phosphodiesterase n=1 Tax=Salirhabdus sp. Marseille-P4669 TaxID=2042310 RepID=UPI000C7A7EEA|nr:GGDEF domain-containing phosphodiesterase [Salirhabdus sp. Marseille-P4669]
MNNNPQTKKITFSEDDMFDIFTTLFDIIFIMKYIPPNDFQYIKVSESAKKLASMQDDDIGKTISELFNHHMAEHLNNHYSEAVKSNGPITFRDRMNTSEAEKYGESVLIPFKHNGESYVIGLTRDVTNVVHLEKNRAKDPITGLPFAENFTRTLNETLHLKEYEGSIWSLFYISITQLSFVQYTNQNTEATLLKEIANRLQRILKSEDMISRISGNEFVLAIRVNNVNECKDLANQMYESLIYPYKNDDYELTVNPAIGVSIIHSETLNIQHAMTNAFESMLRAKGKVDKQIVLPYDTYWSDDGRKYTIERDLPYALSKQEFEVYYQPKLDINRNSLNVEALLRWNHPTFGLIPPNDFIPVSEKNQSIKVIGKWVFEQVCKDIKRFHCINPNLKASINVSPVQLNDANFVYDIKRIVNEYQVDPAKIEIEITESDLLNLSAAQKQFEQLAKAGFHIVLDDFGTSYSSLNYLKELSVQKIKIDKSFIMNMDFLQKDQQIVQMIIKLARNLDLEVTAEGVEKWQHVELLSKMDCNEIQGYYLSKPIPLDKIVQKMEEWVADSSTLFPNKKG